MVRKVTRKSDERRNTSGYPWSNPIRVNNFYSELTLIGTILAWFPRATLLICLYSREKHVYSGETHGTVHKGVPNVPLNTQLVWAITLALVHMHLAWSMCMAWTILSVISLVYAIYLDHFLSDVWHVTGCLGSFWAWKNGTSNILFRAISAKSTSQITLACVLLKY